MRLATHPLLRFAAALVVFCVTARPVEARQRTSQPKGAAPSLPAVKSLTADSKLARTGAQAGGASVTGGQEVVLRVELTAPAPCVERCGGKTVNGLPSGYMRVLLSGDNATQFGAQQMFVNTGQTTGEFNFVTAPVTAQIAFTVSAATEGSAPKSVRLTVVPPVLTGFSIDKSDVVSGTTVRAVANFSGPPATATSVRFQVQTTNGQAVQVPATVTLAPNKTAAEFPVVALGVSQDRNAHIVVMYLDKTLPAPLTVRAAVLDKLERVHSCCGSPFRIVLNGKPPPQGAAIQLVSEHPNRVVVPATVTIPADSYSVALSAQVIPTTSAANVKITATYNGSSKSHNIYVWDHVKPDLVVTAPLLYDNYGNVISTPQNAQPLRLCVTVASDMHGSNKPSLPIPPHILRIGVRTSTGAGTAAGRDEDVPIAFAGMPPKPCVDLSGLEPGLYHEVTFIADFTNKVDESHEGNNTEKVKVSRPPSGDFEPAPAASVSPNAVMSPAPSASGAAKSVTAEVANEAKSDVKDSTTAVGKDAVKGAADMAREGLGSLLRRQKP